MNGVERVLFLILILFISSCSVNNRNTSTSKKSNNCSMILPRDTTTLEIDSNLIKKYPLLPYFTEQQRVLQKHSLANNASLNPDGKYLNGRFDCGIIELKVTIVDGEPVHIYGNTDGIDTQLEFLIYSIPHEEIDKIAIGNTYRIYWIETICFMEPFDHGYERCYIAYKIQ